MSGLGTNLATRGQSGSGVSFVPGSYVPFYDAGSPPYSTASGVTGTVGGASGNHAAAIQAAVDAAGADGGGLVLVPKPSTNWRIGATIDVPWDNVWIVGGCPKTKCLWTGGPGNGPMFNVTGQGVQIHNMWLQPTRCIEGIRFATGADDSALYWTTINTFGSDGGIGVRLSSGSLRVQYCRVGSYQVGGFLVDDPEAWLSMSDTIFIGDRSPGIYGVRIQRGAAYVKGVPLGGGYNAIDVVVDQADAPCLFEGVNVELSEKMLTVGAANTMPITLRSWRGDLNTAASEDGRVIVDEGAGPLRVEGSTISAQFVAPRIFCSLENKVAASVGNAWSKSEYYIRNAGGSVSTVSAGRVIPIDGALEIRTEWPDGIEGTIVLETSADNATGWTEAPTTVGIWTQPNLANGGTYDYSITGLTPGHYFRMNWTYTSGAGAVSFLDRTIWFKQYRAQITPTSMAHGCWEWPSANRPISPTEDGNYYQNIGFDSRIWVPSRVSLTGLGVHDDGVAGRNVFATGLTGASGVATLTALFSHTTEEDTKFRVIGVSFERVSGTLPVGGVSGVVTAKAQNGCTVTVYPTPDGTWQARCWVTVVRYV